MSVPTEGVAASPSLYATLEPLAVTPANRVVAIRWLTLGIAALSGVGLFAIALVLSRGPFVPAPFSNVDLFRVSLVVHVDLSELIRFLAFGGVLFVVNVIVSMVRHADTTAGAV